MSAALISCGVARGWITPPVVKRIPNIHRLPNLPSVKECRQRCICISCRTTKAKFYGEGAGFGVKCEGCIGVRRNRH